MVKTLKNRRGYSLSEAMITVAIVGILVSVAAPLLRNFVNFWRMNTARQEIQRDVRASLDLINRFLRQAKRSQVQIDRADANQPPYSRITFMMEDTREVKFYQSANKLFISVTSGTVTSTRMITDRVGYIAFTYPRTNDNTIISVATTMQSPTYLGGKKALQLSIQKVRIMN
jgi:prepilin-type N-terminal cleavage/methylation domain-containing protein